MKNNSYVKDIIKNVFRKSKSNDVTRKVLEKQ